MEIWCEVMLFQVDAGRPVRVITISFQSTIYGLRFQTIVLSTSHRKPVSPVCAFMVGGLELRQEKIIHLVSDVLTGQGFTISFLFFSYFIYSSQRSITNVRCLLFDVQCLTPSDVLIRRGVILGIGR